MSNWITLPQNNAANHPAYGINGAASFLRAVSVVLPGLGFLQSIGTLPQIISTRGSLLPIDYLLVVPYVVFFLWSGQNAILLGKQNASFIRSFFAFLAAGPVISISVQLIWLVNTGSQAKAETLSVSLLSIILAWGIWAAIWVPYVLFSKRINVTLLNRVKSNDPYLQTVGARDS